MHAYMFNSLEAWDIIGFNVDGLPVILNDTNYCTPSYLSPISDLNTLSMQEKWKYLLCEIYLNNDNTFPDNWTHTLFNTSYFVLENYREKLEELLLNTHDWESEPDDVRLPMIQIFGVNQWKQKVAEYMSWTGLEMTDEYSAWVATQSSFIPSTFIGDNTNSLTIEEEFFIAQVSNWTNPINIKYVLNNCY